MQPEANDNGSESPRILIVEDELLLALAIADDLEAHGYAVLGPADSIEGALTLIQSDPPDAALLDVNLQGARGTSIAEELVRCGIPFAVVTGYARLPEPMLRDAPRLHKPFTGAELTSVVTRLLTRLPSGAEGV